jgi:hypothetical protein
MALGSLVNAAVLAEYLAVDVEYVYRHADELGARRLGTGPKARLRFSIAEVDARLTACPPGRESDAAQTRTVEPKTRVCQRQGLGSSVRLLPIRGQEAPL